MNKKSLLIMVALIVVAIFILIYYFAPGFLGLGNNNTGNSVSVKINELLIDPIGKDSDPSGPRNGGHEVIELVNLSNTEVDLKGWSIRDQAGTVLFQFDTTLLVPAGNTEAHHLLVVLGTKTPSLAERIGTFNDTEPTNAIVFDNNNQGDRLLAKAGAVSLRNESGDIIDAVLWGETEPFGSEVDLIKAEGSWNGAAVSTSVAAGNAPLTEEEGTLGRNINSSDTDGATDWRTHGGPDGLGNSLGYINRPLRYQSALGIVHEVQGYVNEMAAMLSINNSSPNSSYLAITDSRYENLSVSENGNNLTINADHIFEYNSNNNSTGTLKGALAISYVPVAGQSDQMTASGTLTDPNAGLSMEIAITEDLSGFGTPKIEMGLKINMTWQVGTTKYKYAIVSNRVEAWTSQTTLQITDKRDWTDWSTSNPKTGTGTWTIEHTGDGVTKTTGLIERSHPFAPSTFGTITPVGNAKHQVELAFNTLLDSDGQVERKYTQFNMSLVGVTNTVPYVKLNPSQSATMTVIRSAGTIGDRLGTFTEKIELPLILMQGGVAADPKTFSIKSTLVRGTRTTSNGDLVLIEDYTMNMYRDGIADLHLEYFVDGWRYWAAKVAKVAAAGLCAAGAGLTAPSVVGAVAFVAASTITYEIWDEVESQDPD